MGVVQSLRDQLVTHAADTIDVDVGCGRDARQTLKFLTGGRIGEFERHGFGVAGEIRI